MTRLLVALLRAYRFAISPLYGQVCRYYPSCSAYALEAVERHGGFRGGCLALRRLLRCHPWSAGGVDHVPEGNARTCSCVAVTKAVRSNAARSSRIAVK